jgi:protein-S-isoprenylcysteine O-methyltransferase Ste14
MKQITKIWLGYIWLVMHSVFLLPLVLIFLSFLLDKRIGFLPFIPGNSNIYMSIPLFIIGAFWMIWSGIYLVTVGHGHLFAEPGMELQPKTTALVTTGPYKYTRNPMIFGYWMLISSLGIFFDSISLVFVVNPILITLSCLYIIWVEEPWTAKRFGGSYISYKESVPRFIPNLKLIKRK